MQIKNSPVQILQRGGKQQLLTVVFSVLFSVFLVVGVVRAALIFSGTTITLSNSETIDNITDGIIALTADTTYMSGNVGIGTTSPTSILHTIASGAKTADYIGNLLTNTTTSSTASITKTGLSVLSTGTWDGTTAVNRGLYVNATGGTTNYAAIFEGGNVGIGTTAPGQKLDVAGKIGINGTQIIYLPDQTDFLDTLVIGDGGDSLTHTSGSDGQRNLFVGLGAGNANTTGYGNNFIGNQAGYSNAEGYFNNFSGYKAGYLNTTGYTGNFFGYKAGYSNTSGFSNNFFGYNAGYTTGSGDRNSFFGHQAGYLNVDGDNNSYFGYTAGYSATGNGNVFIGSNAGYNSTGSSNIFLGYQAGYNETGSNKLYIENSNSSSPLIYGDFSSDILTVNGSVGIGTTTPTSILHTIASGAKTAGYIGNLLTNTATSSTASVLKTGLSVLSTGTWDGTTAVNRGLYVNATGGTTNYAAIFEGGNVGIGTTSPVPKLDVDGGIRADMVTSDPCAGADFPEATIFYNNTSDYYCYCNGAGADLKLDDSTTACF